MSTFWHVNHERICSYCRIRIESGKELTKEIKGAMFYFCCEQCQKDFLGTDHGKICAQCKMRLEPGKGFKKEAKGITYWFDCQACEKEFMLQK